MNVTTIAVPVTLAAILSYVFQFAKPGLELVPGMRPSDASHDSALRIVYGALVFLAVGGYQLYTTGAPSGVDGWLSLVLALLTTATTMAVAAHYNYQAMSGTSAASVSPPMVETTLRASDFPPGVPLPELQAQLAPAAE